MEFNKKIIIILLILLNAFHSYSQNTLKYVSTDAQAIQIPKNSTYSVENIASYIKTNFSHDEEKVRAAFYWISQNISYDISAINEVVFYENEQQLIAEVLKKRKGICMHYAVLFDHICKLSGVKSHWIGGITRQNNELDKSPHAWNIVNIYGKWQIIDPTWGSGQIENGKFVRKLNNSFFDSKPEEMIHTHCPFNPMWQLLTYPVSNKAFITGNIVPDKDQPAWNINDSILAYEKQDTLTRETVLLKRMQKSGIENELLVHEWRTLKYNIEVKKRNESVDFINQAVFNFNEGVKSLNEFIAYRNNHFNPKKEDVEIQQMLDNVSHSFQNSKNKMQSIKTKDEAIIQSLNQIKNLVDNAEVSLKEQQVFLNKYIETPRLTRKTVFYDFNLIKKTEK
jgi:hypothetical protein